MIKGLLQSGRPRFDPWVGKIPWRRKWLVKPPEFLKLKVINGLCNVSEVTFGEHPSDQRVGAYQNPTIQGGERSWRLNPSPVSDELIMFL